MSIINKLMNNKYLKENNENVKKILCCNIINNNKCAYGTKCLFAHSLQEQQKDVYRNIIIQMIEGDDDLSYINICNEKKIYEELMVYTKECIACIQKQCKGGYNCKHGTCLSNLRVCKYDLQYGKCKRIVENGKCCNGIHLSMKGLMPYYIQLYTFPNTQFLFNDVAYFCKNLICVDLNDKSIEIIKKIIENDKNYDALNHENEWRKQMQETHTITEDADDLFDSINI